MTVVTVKALYGETRSVNFQSATVEVGMEAELDEGEDAGEAQLELERRCVEAVKAGFDRHKERKVKELVDKAGKETK